MKPLCDKLNRLPPWACRVLARKNNRWNTTSLTNCEIAHFGNLSVRNVIRISKLQTWDGVKLSMIEKFATGCHIDMSRIGEQLKYLRRNKLRFLRNAHPKTRGALIRLIKQAGPKLS